MSGNEVTARAGDVILIAQVPGKTHRIAVNPGDRIELVAALEQAGITKSEAETASVNGKGPADNNTMLQGGDKVTVSKGAKGALDITIERA
jgi:hypothetical protein